MHDKTRKWYEMYIEDKKDHEDKIIPPLTLEFLKFFIRSKSSFEDLKCNNLLNCFQQKLRLNSYDSFRNKLIPSIRN